MKNKFLFIFGTRPEAIKLAPLIKDMMNEDEFVCKLCVTGQHQKMLYQVLDFFQIKPDYDLQLMKENQTLTNITADILKELDVIIQNKFKPDFIIVQGDTTTAMAASLVAFYSKIKIIHIEAGLRSNEKFSPFPEEVNRVIITKIADLHFAPTEAAVNNLLKDGVNKKYIWNVGNTVIDALFIGLNKIKKFNRVQYDDFFSFLDRNKKIILITGHRRENFGEAFENICYAIKEIAKRNEDVEIVYPVHLNPNVKIPAERILKNNERIHLIEPLDYSHLIWLLSISKIVVTDSGGIQEEAPSLGKPVLVMREVTERMEGVEAGTAKIVGTRYEDIVNQCQRLLTDIDYYNGMAQSINPYGDGTASKQIVDILKKQLNYNYGIGI